MSDFIIGAGIGAICWIAGNVMWEAIERHKKGKQSSGICIGGTAVRSAPSTGIHSNGPQTTITMYPAINGRIIEIGNYKPNMNGPEWTYEHFIVAEGEPLEPAISTIRLMKGMK